MADRLFLFLTLISIASPARGDGLPPAPDPAAVIADLKPHDRAVFVKTGWIRDPYIIPASDGFFYLTGTTPLPDDPREQADPFNTGLGPTSIVGWKLRVWRSKELARWESLGEPFTLKDGVWFRDRPAAFRRTPESQWRLWAPELHEIDGKWAIVHTSPAPVRGSNLSFTKDLTLAGPFNNPLGVAIGHRHDPSLFKDDDGAWWLVYGATTIVKLKKDFTGLDGEPVDIHPTGAFPKIGHEGCLVRRIGKKYVLFGTGWSTGEGRKGSYNLYCATADRLAGPYSERRFAGRFLGHGTPFQDRDGRWWCTAFYNGNVPPLPVDGITMRDLRETAQTINRQGVTLVPMTVSVGADGDVTVRAADPVYATPGPDEKQKFGR